MLNTLPSLGEVNPLPIVDGGNRFYAYQVANPAGKRPDDLNHLPIPRMFIWYQVHIPYALRLPANTPKHQTSSKCIFLMPS